MQGLRQGSVLCKLKHLHCQDSFSAARQISVALLTKRCLVNKERYVDIGFSALGRDTWHRLALSAGWSNNIGFGVRCNRLGAILTPKILERRLNHEKKTWRLSVSSHHVCLSNLSASLWVLCRLEVCPYKPRGLSLLGQSVIMPNGFVKR